MTLREKVRGAVASAADDLASVDDATDHIMSLFSRDGGAMGDGIIYPSAGAIDAVRMALGYPRIIADEVIGAALVSAYGAEGFGDRLASAERVVKRARVAISDFDDLVGSSEGVYGLHLNGDPAPWESILAGGAYDYWTEGITTLRAALSSHRGQGDG